MINCPAIGLPGQIFGIRGKTRLEKRASAELMSKELPIGAKLREVTQEKDTVHSITIEVSLTDYRRSAN
jgi:hypothetical protein